MKALSKTLRAYKCCVVKRPDEVKQTRTEHMKEQHDQHRKNVQPRHISPERRDAGD